MATKTAPNTVGKSKSIASLLGQAMARVSVAESPDYAPMAKGIYTFTIQKAEFKPNKAGTGYLLSVGSKTDKNRWLYHNFNLINPNPTAQMIGAQQFADLIEQLSMDASQFTTPESFQALEGCDFNAYVNIKDGQNVFSNFKQKAVPVKKFQDDPMSGEIPF